LKECDVLLIGEEEELISDIYPKKVKRKAKCINDEIMNAEAKYEGEYERNRFKKK
jgi:hypothetical protein